MIEIYLGVTFDILAEEVIEIKIQPVYNQLGEQYSKVELIKLYAMFPNGNRLLVGDNIENILAQHYYNTKSLNNKIDYEESDILFCKDYGVSFKQIIAGVRLKLCNDDHKYDDNFISSVSLLDIENLKNAVSLKLFSEFGYDGEIFVISIDQNT